MKKKPCRYDTARDGVAVYLYLMLFYTRDHYINDFNHAHRLITVRIINNGRDDGGSGDDGGGGP